MKICLTIILLSTHVLGSIAQDMQGHILSMIYTDSSAIRSENILSLHVYSELSENNYDDSENYILSRKRSEIEFNDIGLRIYERSDNINSRSRALGDGNTEHTSYTYDEKRRISSSCFKNKQQFNCQYITYNDEDKITSIKNEGGSVDDELLTFKWENGLMIEAKNTNVEESDYFFERFYNKQGRISEMRQGNGHLSTYQYVDNGKETKMISTFYFKDSLISKTVYTGINTTDQITYYCELDENLDTLSETIATYNEKNDLVELKYIDNRERLYSMRNSPEPGLEQVDGDSESVRRIEPAHVTVYTIENIYDNGLLIKRVINVSKDNGYNENKHRIVERFIYEKTPLGHNSWPSEEEEEYDLYDNLDSPPPPVPPAPRQDN